MGAMTYTTLDRNEKLSEHFHAREFECVGEKAITVGVQLLQELEKVRNHFNEPVHINSGFRNKEHNAKVGGKANSKHLMGIAADIWVENVSPKEVYDYINTELWPKTGGLGLYETFVHMDTRAEKARWIG